MDEGAYETISRAEDLKGPADATQMRKAIERCAKASPGERMTIVAAMDPTHGLSAYTVFAESASGTRRFVHPTGILGTLLKQMCMTSMVEQRIYALKVKWNAGTDWVARREDARDPMVTEILIQIARLRIAAGEADRDGIGGMLEISLSESPERQSVTVH